MIVVIYAAYVKHSNGNQESMSTFPRSLMRGSHLMYYFSYLLKSNAYLAKW